MTILIRSISTGSDNGGSATISVVTSESPQATQVGDTLILIHGNDFYALSNMPIPSVSPGSPTVNGITNGTADGGTNLGHLKSYNALPNTAGAQTGSATETGSHDEEKSMFAVVLAGVDTSNIIDVAANSSGTSSTTQTAPAVSPSTSDALLICILHSGGGAATTSYTAPGSMSNKTEIHNGGLSAVLATEQLSASGSTGTRVFTAANAVPWVAVTIAIRTAAAATATFPPPNIRSRRPAPYRVTRSRQTTPVRAQVNPPNPIQEITQPRRVRGLLQRRTKLTVVIQPQVNPPYPHAEIRPTRQLRGLLPRRGRTVTPVPAQVVVTPPPYPPQTVRIRPRVLRVIRGHQAQPVPPQVVIQPPVFVPDRPHRARPIPVVRRGHTITQVPAQAGPASAPCRRRGAIAPAPRRSRNNAPPSQPATAPATARRRPPAIPRTRPHAAAASPPGYPPPLDRPRRGPRPGSLRRTRATGPVPANAAPAVVAAPGQLTSTTTAAGAAATSSSAALAASSTAGGWASATAAGTGSMTSTTARLDPQTGGDS